MRHLAGITCLLLTVLSCGSHAEWYLRGSFNGWGTTPMVPLDDDVVYVNNLVVNENGSFKFDRWGDWQENYGVGGLNGSNISISAGYYDIHFNPSLIDWVVVPAEFHFRGTSNNWSEGDVMTPVSGEASLVETCQYFSGENSRFKIDPNGQWGDDFPASDVGVQEGWVKIVVDIYNNSIYSIDEALNENCSSDYDVADEPNLKTWWHDSNIETTGAFNSGETVRRSTEFDITIAPGNNANQRFKSFDYMSVPRRGLGANHVDGCVSPADGYCRDGADFSATAGATMSWTSFLYDQDGAYVYVQSEHYTNENDVSIRPKRLQSQLTIEPVNSDTVRIFVPYIQGGVRFSVEFDSVAMTTYTNEQSNGPLTDSNPNGNLQSVHTEPRHSLLVFAEPMLSASEQQDLIPPLTASSTVHVAQSGFVDLDSIDKEIIVFPAGEYYMGENNHAYLHENTRWVYLAPGAYVKGALQFRGVEHDFKVTGFGVLSGEQYVYEADKTNGYQRRLITQDNCHGDCVKMLEFASSVENQTLTVQGITIANPPYHSFVVYEDALNGNAQFASTFDTTVNSYKQVGAWYWQTDGIELYEGGEMQHAFLHANDDVLKIYHSDVAIDDVVVWKGENGPVIQFGWVPRNIENSTVTNVDIIHNQMYWSDVKHNHCIINSARHYQDSNALNMADESQTIRNLRFENIHSEGQNLCAMRFMMLSNWYDITVKNLTLDTLNGLSANSQQSTFKRGLDSVTNNPMGIGFANYSTLENHGLTIQNYCVNGQVIGKYDGNWQSSELGRLNFDGDLWDHWNASYDYGFSCPN